MLPFLKRRTESKCSSHLDVGRSGERIAARYLQSLPYHIAATNVKVGHRDEIDIVAYDPSDEVTVFVEVKTRNHVSDDFLPEMNLTQRKRKALWRAARRWMSRSKLECGFRIDLVCVVGGQVVDHFKEIQPPRSFRKK